jgi:hypothetical protein
VVSEPWYGAAGQYSWLTQFEGDRMSMVRRWLVVAAGLFAVAELIDGIVYRLLPGIVFGVVLGRCTWWASRSRG